MNKKSLANLQPFSSEKQPKHRKPRGPSPMTALKKLLGGSIEFDNPLTKLREKGKAIDVIALRHLLNATSGKHEAITDIFDRFDGKPIQPTSHEGGIDINVHILKDDQARPKH